MAVTQNTYTGNGSTVLYSFTFPYLDTSHIQVEVNGAATTAYTLANATTIQFNTAPANGASIRIYRKTTDTQLLSTFFSGSAIRAQDLNEDFNQSLYISQETRNETANAVAGQIADGSIGTSKIADNSVTTAKIADNSVTTAKIADGTIVNADVNASAGIVASKLSFTQSGTGAVARSVDVKLKDTVSVKDFGATGDGLTDDTDAITRALSALLTRGGGVLYFPAGIYSISAGIPLVGKVHYCGESRQASIIRQSSWDAVIGMGYRTGIAEDPVLTSGPLNSDTTIPAKIKQSDITRLNGVIPTYNYWKISNLTLDGGADPLKPIHKDDAFGNVIRLENHAYGEICSCNIINSWNQGISIYFYSNNITVHDCTFKNIGQSGGTAIGYLPTRYYTGNAIFVEFSSDRTIVTGNIFESVDQRCIWYTCAGEAGDNKQKDHIFADNIGFYTGNTAAVEAIYNGIYSAGYERIAGIHGLRITGNRLIATNIVNNIAGIYLGNAMSVEITGNYIYNRQWGMQIQNCRGVVGNNIFHTCTSGAILLNNGLTPSYVTPTFSNDKLINTPNRFYTPTTTGIDTFRRTLVFGNLIGNARTIAPNGTLNFTLTQGDITFSSDRFIYRCSMQLYRQGGGFNYVQAEFFIGRGFAGGGGFRYYWGVTTPTWLIDPDNLRTFFSLNFDSSTGILTLTSTDASLAYTVGLTVEYVDIESI